jgi:acetylornithine/N-succinyldiaminopimelate aminotransferase
MPGGEARLRAGSALAVNSSRERRHMPPYCFLEDLMSHVMNTYARLPVAFERGEGVWLWDTQGRRYLDALAGIAVCGLGYAHPRFTAALREQLGLIVHTSNLFEIPAQERLAERLALISGLENAFFCNS